MAENGGSRNEASRIRVPRGRDDAGTEARTGGGSIAANVFVKLCECRTTECR